MAGWSGEAREVVLDIEGMTCASCVDRVERVLSRQDGVEATAVNLASRTAIVRTTLDPIDPLITAVEKAGYGARPHEEGPRADGASDLSRRLLVSALCTYEVLVLALFFHGTLPSILAWLGATPVLFYGGAPFIRSALRNARHRTSTMDTLIAVGSVSAYGYSLWSLVRGRHEAYFDTSAVIVTLVLTGKVIEARVRDRAGDAARTLLERGAKDATVIRGGAEVRVPVEDLHVGDLAVVMPGEKIPSDGVVREGASWIDLSMLTGESNPIDVAPGAEVVGASLNGHGRLLIEVTKTGSQTKLAEIVRVLRSAQGSKAPIQRLADRISASFVPKILLLAGLTAIVGSFLLPGGVPAALQRATAVLLVACPCALGLATPAAIMAGSGRAAELGILFKGGEVFEAARRIDIVLLDKTGTVTEGRMRLSQVIPRAGLRADEVLSLAAAAERGSEHPIATAIVEGAADRGLVVPPASAFAVEPGAGARAQVGGHRIRVGRPEDVPDDVADQASALAGSGLTTVAVWRDDQAIGLIGVADRVKPESRVAVERLKAYGFEVRLVTGDRRAAAAAVAAQAGIIDVVAEVFPQDKVEEVRRLQEAGKRVAFVGDGINDGPALAQADVGIALGTGTDVAIEAADVMVLGGDPRAAANALFLAGKTYWVITQNLAWAFSYNAITIPLALIGRLTPGWAAAAMALSSVSVVTNAVRLRLFAHGQGPDGEDSVHAGVVPVAQRTV